MAHDASHDGHHGAGHGAHHAVNPDKGAAFAGLFAGMLLLGSLLFGMVKWTNHHLGGGEAGAAAESTK